MLTKAKVIETSRASSHPNRALWMLCLTTIAIFSNMYATQPILPVIGQEFGLKPSEAGLTVSVMVLAIALSAVFYGVLSDKVGRKPVIIGSTFALVVPTFLCAIAPNFALLIVFRIGQGLLIPGFIATTITYIHEEFAENRGIAVGWYTASSIMGGFTGRVQGGLTTDFIGWRFSFLSFALINLISGYVLLRYLPVSRHFKDSNPRLRSVNRSWRSGLSLKGLLACFKNRRLLGAYLVGPAIFFPFIGLFTYLPYYLIQPPFNLSNLVISFIFVVYLAGLISAPISGRFSEKLGRRKVMASGIFFMALGILITAVPLLIGVFAGLLLLCFGMFAVQTTANAYIGDSVGAGQGRASAVSLYQLFFYLGGSFGGFIPGLLWQSGGWVPLVGCCLVSLGVGLGAIRWLCT